MRASAARTSLRGHKMKVNPMRSLATRGLLPVAALAMATVLVAAAAAGACRNWNSGGQGNTPLPTVVLVHGAWADASSWEQVIPLLQHDGYTVVAPPNPL